MNRITPTRAVEIQARYIEAPREDVFLRMWERIGDLPTEDTGVIDFKAAMLDGWEDVARYGETVYLPPETVALVHHAAQQLPADEPLSLDDMPFERVCVFLGEPLTLPVEGYVSLCIDAFLIMRIRDGGRIATDDTEITSYIGYACAREEGNSVGAILQVFVELGPVGAPVGSVTCDIVDGGIALKFSGFIHALWHIAALPMMNTTTARPIEPGARKARKKLAGRGNVNVIGLRHRPAITVAGSPAVARTYRCQWVVRGYWRRQACGVGRTERRRVWVNSYIKGPSDAPLVVSRKVYKVQP